jgi:hypothetical protein
VHLEKLERRKVTTDWKPMPIIAMFFCTEKCAFSEQMTLTFFIACYGSGQAGVFTSGGTQSNLMGVLLARDWCISKNWNSINEPAGL